MKYFKYAAGMKSGVCRDAVERVMLAVIDGGKHVDISKLSAEELRMEILNLGCSKTVFGKRPVDLFEVCSMFCTPLLPYLYEHGLRPRAFEDMCSYPIVDALSENRLEDAYTLHKCGHRIFTERGVAISTFGYYGRFGADDYFFCGEFGRSGDIFDALFHNAQIESLVAAISMSTAEQLDRRDAAGECIFTSKYIMLSLFSIACMNTK